MALYQSGRLTHQLADRPTIPSVLTNSANPSTTLFWVMKNPWHILRDLHVTFRVIEDVAEEFLFWWQVKVAPLSSRMTGVTHTLLRPSLFPSFRLIRASFLRQTNSSSVWETLLLGSQTRDTVSFSRTSRTPSLLTAGTVWIVTPQGEKKAEIWNFKVWLSEAQKATRQKLNLASYWINWTKKRWAS